MINPNLHLTQKTLSSLMKKITAFDFESLKLKHNYVPKTEIINHCSFETKSIGHTHNSTMQEK